MRLRPMQSRKAIMNEGAPVRNYFPAKSVLRGAKVKESESFGYRPSAMRRVAPAETSRSTSPMARCAVARAPNRNPFATIAPVAVAVAPCGPTTIFPVQGPTTARAEKCGEVTSDCSPGRLQSIAVVRVA